MNFCGYESIYIQYNIKLSNFAAAFTKNCKSETIYNNLIFIICKGVKTYARIKLQKLVIFVCSFCTFRC